MSEETDTLIVYVRREVRETIALTVPKGWKPESDWDLVQVINNPEELPKYRLPYWDPAVVKAWPDAWRLAKSGEKISKLCGPIDARESIAKMPRGYDPDELRELQEQGAKAWAGVPDADEWVRELRGGNL